MKYIFSLLLILSLVSCEFVEEDKSNPTPKKTVSLFDTINLGDYLDKEMTSKIDCQNSSGELYKFQMYSRELVKEHDDSSLTKMGIDGIFLFDNGSFVVNYHFANYLNGGPGQSILKNTVVGKWFMEEDSEKIKLFLDEELFATVRGAGNELLLNIKKLEDIENVMGDFKYDDKELRLYKVDGEFDLTEEKIFVEDNTLVQRVCE